MRRGEVMFLVVAVALLLFIGSPAESALLRVPDTLTCALSLQQPALSYEFTPVVDGPLQIDLDFVQGALSGAGPQRPVNSMQLHQTPTVQLVVFRNDANGTPQSVAAGRLEDEAGLTLYLSATADPERPYRALLSLGAASESAACRLSVRGLNTRGSTLLVRGDAETTLRAAATQRELASWPQPATLSQSVAFSPAGDRFLAGQGTDYTLIATFTGEELGTTTFPPGAGNEADLQFVPGVARLLPSCVTGTLSVGLFNSQDLSFLGSYSGTRTALSPTSAHFVVYGASTASIIELDSGTVVGQWDEGTRRTEAKLSPDGRTVALWEAEPVETQLARLFDTATGGPLGEPFLFSQLEQVLFSPEGNRLLWIGIVDGQRRALLQSTSDGSLIRTGGLSLFTRGTPLQAYFGPLGRRILLATSGESPIPWASLYDSDDGGLLQPFTSFGPVLAVRCHPLGKTLLIVGVGDATDELEIKFVDAAQGTQLKQYNPVAFQWAEYDPTGRRLALVGKWEAEDAEWEEVQILDGLQGTKLHNENADDWLDPIFSPNGERLVAHSFGLSLPDYISPATIWDTVSGTQIRLKRAVGEIDPKGITPDSTRYYFMSRLSSSLQLLYVMDLADGGQVGSNVRLTGAASPLLTLDGKALLYVGRQEGQAMAHIGRVRLADAQVRRGGSIQYATAGPLRWSGDGKRMLFDYTTGAGQHRTALIDALSLTVLGDYPAEAGAEFDSTVRPQFLSFDFDGDGDVGLTDLFELQRKLDPDYPEVLHDFFRASRWR